LAKSFDAICRGKATRILIDIATGVVVKVAERATLQDSLDVTAKDNFFAQGTPVLELNDQQDQVVVVKVT